MLSYEIGGTRRRIFFGRAEALSLMQPGAERDFDPREPYSPVSRETAFNRTFFLRLADEMESANAFPTPAGDGSEYDAEEAQQERYKNLGVRRGSRYLNIGVDNQVTWPSKETLTKFDKYEFVLMPKTQDHVQSIHIDLNANRLTDRDAITVINRFLSIMTWCDDQFAIAQDGWSGNPVPVPYPNEILFSRRPITGYSIDRFHRPKKRGELSRFIAADEMQSKITWSAMLSSISIKLSKSEIIGPRPKTGFGTIL